MSANSSVASLEFSESCWLNCIRWASWVTCIHIADANREKFPIHSPHDIQSLLVIPQICYGVKVHNWCYSYYKVILFAQSMQIQSIQICVQTEDTALAKNTLKIKRTLNLRFSLCVCVCVCVCEALSPAPLPLKISSLGSLNRGLLSFADVISQNLFESLSPALSDLPVASPCILDLETVCEMSSRDGCYSGVSRTIWLWNRLSLCSFPAMP